MSQELPKTQHLILLVGENPLPNYVAANLLLLPEGTVHLAHTNGTQRQAKQLRKVLESRNVKCSDLPLGSSEAKASAIRSGINERIKSLEKGSIGLHYTGGTKAMAVHAYLALKEYDTNAYFIYLDSRHLELCIDQTSSDPQRISITPEMLKVDILELMELHGWEKQSDPVKQPFCIKAAEKFQKFHQDQNAAEEWRKWCNFYFKNNGKWKRDSELKTINIEEESFLRSVDSLDPFDISSYSEILDALQVLGVQKGFSIQEIKEKLNFNKHKDVWKWLDGAWLEHYVLDKVQEIAEQQKISDSANSFFIKNPKQPENTKFEVDVLFTRGYQLFAISCTTSNDKDLCKSKLFEAYIRAQQLGGTETRIALVCCANSDDTNRLKTQITNVFTPIGSEPDDYKIEVFGREDLPDLASKIAQWIKNVDRDTK
jgi:hypothetical protein